MDKAGKIESMTEVLHEKERREYENRKNSNSNVQVDGIGFGCRIDIPVGTINQNYYISRGASNSIDTAGIFFYKKCK